MLHADNVPINAINRATFFIGLILMLMVVSLAGQCLTGMKSVWFLKAGDKRNQTQNDTGGVCQYDGVVAFFFQKAVGKP